MGLIDVFLQSSWREALVANAHRLLRSDIETLVRIDVGCTNADARFIGKVRLESVVERLFHECVTVSEEKHFLRVTGPPSAR
jgi:hypothetical protein